MKTSPCSCRSRSRYARRRTGFRNGTTLVEVALTLPVFFAFLFGMLEYSRVKFVSNMLTVACRNGARLGATENVTTAQAAARVRSILSALVEPDKISVDVKDAKVFDTVGPHPSTPGEYSGMTDLELNSADSRQLFLVRVSVNYNDVAIVPFSGLNDVDLTAHSLMRHE